jgi:hypothetical protein
MTKNPVFNWFSTHTTLYGRSFVRPKQVLSFPPKDSFARSFDRSIVRSLGVACVSEFHTTKIIRMDYIFISSSQIPGTWSRSFFDR